MSYAAFADFEKYVESYGTNYYGTFSELAGTITINTSKWQDDIDFSYNNINTILDSIGKIPLIPVGTQPRTGSYHPALIELNVCDAIYRKFNSRHIQEMNGKLPDWMTWFGTRCMQIFDDIETEKISFSTDTIRTGIGIPVKIRTSGYATLHNNWDFGFYSASDYPKTFHIKITGTIDGNGFGQTKFKWSEDSGVTFLAVTEQTVGSLWINIANGLQVRWQAGSAIGTNNQFEYNDEWKIECVPTQVRTSGFRSTFNRFGRG